MESQIQIQLTTKQEKIAVADVPLSVPSNIECPALNDLINQLLKESTSEDYHKAKNFDFLVNNQLLRVPLSDYLKEHGLSTEATIEIEYIERTPAPEPETSILHDDWVSSLHVSDKWILTGCYDYSVNIWTTHGRIVTTNKYHTNIVKGVSWLNQNDPSKGFVSVSHDLSAILWNWQIGSDTIQPLIRLKGHERGIDSVGVSPNSLQLATGGWDTNLKIWSASLDEDIDEAPLNKKSKTTNNIHVRTPKHTLEGHKEMISSINWVDNNVICTSSMDHTIKFWDVQLYGIKNEIVGQKAYLDSSWSCLNNLLLASSADRFIRLYDPRSNEGAVCKTTFTSHQLWVSCVSWSKYDTNLFMSGGYDSEVKFWDMRSPKAPLYNLQGHEGQVLCVDWSYNNKYLVSGGTDNSVHVFKNKQIC